MSIFRRSVAFSTEKRRAKFGVCRKRIHYESVKNVSGQLSIQKTNVSAKIIPHSSASVKKAFSENKCICGYIYIGHANNETPPRLIFSKTDSIAVSGNPPYRHAYTEIDTSNLVSGNVSAIFGCNSASTFFADESIAEVLSKHFGGDVLGSNRGLNFTINGEAVRGTLAALKPEFPLWEVFSNESSHEADERCKCKKK